MAFTDAEMRALSEYDRWKTTPDDEEKCIEECSDCGAELFEGDPYWMIDGNIYCQKCIENAKHYIEAYSLDE